MPLEMKRWKINLGTRLIGLYGHTLDVLAAYTLSSKGSVVRCFILSSYRTASYSQITLPFYTMSPELDQEIAPPPPKRAKLHGRAFYESIGSPKRVVAPMVDASELVYEKYLPRLQKTDS